ncbi:alpha/beta fold hydrolase [Noviherbaspirillum autotrophicum]|uniref:Alpha/beta hydrolase n=1 Tax=Noviherbaspirillum autotrophicum TaxID=709839 RepID=A0A0C1Y6G4_9BURK|nr:alpha/beta hydrolase [Noviherbaspirillum autotrophicum]KIF82543.1 alpha/beta hydrolase [Noviherbaspirillum autotrophicum]
MNTAIQTGQYASLPNGIRLHYASAGEKGRPLLLFVHGFPEFWYEWEAQLKEFGRDYFAVAPDLRGFNLSDMPADVGAYKARHIVDDLRLLAAHLGYEKFVLVAHDWGGAIAWNLAIALPQLLHKLIIINSPHPYLFMKALATDPAQKEASGYMNWLRAEGSEQALAKDDFALMEGILSGMGRTPTPWFAGDVRAKYHECWSRGIAGGVNYYRASPLHPPTDDHPGPLKLQLNPDDFRVSVPTRVIWGESDIALPKTLADGLEDFSDDLKVERIPEGSHWVVHEQPERINRLIRGFLSE